MFRSIPLAVATLILISTPSGLAQTLTRSQGLSLSAQTLGPQKAKKYVDGLRRLRRESIVKKGRAVWGTNDDPGLLLEGAFTKKLTEMQGRESAALTGENAPWSDSYWPLYAGQLAARYADPNFAPDASSFMNTWKNFIEGGSVCARDNLSPAEKYDLLMGLDSRTPQSLTAQAWRSAGQYAQDGKVESWMGICHGWAPAAYMLPRPKKAVTLKASDGRPLTFYVSDIKALGTLLWATGATNEKFIGGRCNLKSSQLLEMGESARKRYPECWDTNAGTWHTVLINQLAKGRSFVMDATADYEVWNQPVQAYQLQYYSPVTKRPGSLKSAIDPYSEFQSKDPLTALRDKRRVKYIVGVRMNLTYVAENAATHLENARDATRVKYYDYDLELNSAYEIIGGEWHQDDHPDFLWTPPHEFGEDKTKMAINNSQAVASSWDPRLTSVPRDWNRAAAAVAMADQPLSRVVELLFALSRPGQ